MKNENVLPKLLLLLLLDLPLWFWRLASLLFLVSYPLGSLSARPAVNPLRENERQSGQVRERGERDSCDPDKRRVWTLSRPP
jgi:hypothetical protein